VFNVVPVGDVATRDEFEKIKNITDHDISTAWGTRPEVAGIMPTAVGGTGDIDKLHYWDYEVKTKPLINLVLEKINERLNKVNRISFAEPTFI
jgi:capsid portal protein